MALVPTTRVGIHISVNKTGAERSFRELGIATTKLRGFAKNLDLSFRSLDRTLGLIAIGSLAIATTKFVKMAAELERAELQIKIFSKSAEEVPKVMESILKLSSRVPFNINELTKSFVRLKASGLEPISDAQGNGLLKNFSDGVAAFGGDADILKRAIIGVQQTIGKGAVSMEELRQQIGEAIPTAMRVMASQLKISVAELIQTVSRGGLESKKGILALSEGLKKNFGGAGEALKATFLGQIGEFENVLTKLSKALIKDTGALDVFTAAMVLVNKEIEGFTKKMKGKEGEAIIEKFTNQMLRLAGFVHDMIGPFQDFIGILGGLVSMIANITGALPAEVVSGGLIGFLIFGRSGLVAGALFGAFSKEITAIVQGTAVFVEAMFAVAKSFGLDTTLGGGLIGFLIYGRKGALIGMAAGLVTDLVSSLSNLGAILSAWFQGVMISFSTQWTEGFKRFARLDFDFAAIKASGDKAKNEFWASFVKENPELFKKAGEKAGENIGLGLAKGAKPFVEKLQATVAGVKATRDKFKGRSIDETGGLDDNEQKALVKLTTFMNSLSLRAAGGGDALSKTVEGVKIKLIALDGIIGSVTKRMNELKAGDSKIAGLASEIVKLGEMRNKVSSDIATIVETQTLKTFTKLDAQITRTRLSLNKFLVGTPEAFNATDLAVAKVKDRMAGFTLRIVQLRSQLPKLTQNSERYNITLGRIIELEKLLAAAQKNSIRVVTELTEARKKAAAASIEEDVKKAGFAVGKIAGQTELDKVAEAGFNAQLKILALEKTIRISMKKINDSLRSGDINPAFAKRQIELLEASRAKLEANSKEFIERAEFNATRFGELMNDVAQSMEDGFADALGNLISGTKTAKEVLLDFYAEITRAVIRYLAKQALIGAGINNDGGGGGQALGSIFKGIGSLFQGGGGTDGGSISGVTASDISTGEEFAHGGSFTVRGHGGVDNNVLALNGRPVANVSAGETVDVSPEGSRGGDNYNITIQAMDSQDVSRLFNKHGADIIGAMRSRSRLNRGMDRRA